jgi:hypothetical protein
LLEAGAALLIGHGVHMNTLTSYKMHKKALKNVEKKNYIDIEHPQIKELNTLT